jgi:hypothetical protein
MSILSTKGAKKMSDLFIEKGNTMEAIAAGESPPIEQVNDLLKLCDVAEQLIKKARDHAKARLEDGEEMADYELKPGRASYTFDTKEVFTELKTKLGDKFDASEWMKMLKLGKTDLERFVKSCGGSKELLEPLMEKKEGKPTMKAKA